MNNALEFEYPPESGKRYRYADGTKRGIFIGMTKADQARQFEDWCAKGLIVPLGEASPKVEKQPATVQEPVALAAEPAAPTAAAPPAEPATPRDYAAAKGFDWKAEESWHEFYKRDCFGAFECVTFIKDNAPGIHKSDVDFSKKQDSLPERTARWYKRLAHCFDDDGRYTAQARKVETAAATVPTVRKASTAKIEEIVAKLCDKPPPGSGVAKYLQSRGLNPDNLPASVKCRPHPFKGQPCGLVGLASKGKDNVVVCLTQTYVTGEGEKAPPGGIVPDDRRRTWGAPRGNPVRMGAGELVLVEGIEDALSIYQNTECEAWACLGVDNLAHARVPKNSTVTIFRDGDAEDSRAADALSRAIGTFQKCGCKVMLTQTPPGEDANSVLVKQGAAALRALIDGAVEAEPVALVDVPTSAPALPWRDFKDKYGTPAVSLANTVIAIKALGIECRYNLFRHRVLIEYNGKSMTVQNLIGELTDDALGAIRSLINNTYRLDPGEPNVMAAVREVARDNAFDPVLDYLEQREKAWDGKPRLDAWLRDYCGSPDNQFISVAGAKHLIAGVRRARQPGVKYDNILVLESPEGRNKSTAIELLAGKEYFSDQTILGVKDKEAQENVQGIWIYEIADLSEVGKADVNHVKAFASRTTDRARKAYGRVREDVPRRFVPFGTTNDDRYLKSQTGNRRFLPAPVGRIDLEALARDRNQLWGEAAARESKGESIMLPEELWSVAAVEQEKRRETDPWEDVLTDIPEHVLVGPNGAPHQIVWCTETEERVRSADLMEHVLRVPPMAQTTNHGRRLATCMRLLGWETTESGTLQINGKSVRGYKRKRQFWTPTGQGAMPLGDSTLH